MEQYIKTKCKEATASAEFCRKNCPGTQEIQSLNWLNVRDTLFLNDAVMVHKCLHDGVPAYSSDKFTLRSAVHKRSTRHCNDLNLPKCIGSLLGKECFSIEGLNCIICLVILKLGTRFFKKRLGNELRKNLLG